MNALTELQGRIEANCHGSSTDTAIAGLGLLRADGPSATPMPAMYSPMVCVIAQGRKQVVLGERSFEYDAAKYLISSVHLPVTGAVVEATPARPYLALSLDLDVEIFSNLLLAMPQPDRVEVVPLALAVTATPAEMIEAFVRLLRLLDRPAEVAPLAPLIVREIHYRLLAGEQAAMLRQITMEKSRTGQVIRAIQWIRCNYAKPFRMSELTRVANMSAPSLHRHFKAVTTMSPLQYQKQLRLQEARQLLVAQKGDAATVAFSVGYGSPSQFSREYARLYGAPPRQDASRVQRERA